MEKWKGKQLQPYIELMEEFKLRAKTNLFRLYQLKYKLQEHDQETLSLIDEARKMETQAEKASSDMEWISALENAGVPKRKILRAYRLKLDYQDNLRDIRSRR